MATDAITAAIEILVAERHALLLRLGLLDTAVETLTKIKDSGTTVGAAAAVSLTGVSVMLPTAAISQYPDVPTTVHGKTNTRPFLARVLQEHPGKHHVKQITEWLSEYVQQTAKNPVNANATTLLRMQEAGVVKNHGGNMFEWVGEAQGALPVDETDESSAA